MPFFLDAGLTFTKSCLSGWELVSFVARPGGAANRWQAPAAAAIMWAMVCRSPLSLSLTTWFSLHILAFQGLETGKNVAVSTVLSISKAGIRFA